MSILDYILISIFGTVICLALLSMNKNIQEIKDALVYQTSELME